MKKWLFLICLILSIGCISACNNASNISYAYSKIELSLNDEWQLKNEYVKCDDINLIKYEIDDESVAKIEDNKIISVSKGETYLNVYNKNNKHQHIKVLIVVEEIILTETASVLMSIVNINMAESNINFNSVVIDEESNEIPNVTYDDTLINYNYSTGVIVAKDVGNVRVDVEFKKCSVTFFVIITNKVYATYMNCEDVELYENSKGKFSFTIFPSYATEYTFYTNDSVLKVDKSGNYEVVGRGTANVYYYYYKADGIRANSKFFKVQIVNPIKDFDMTITELNGQTPSVYLMGKVYRLNMDLTQIKGKDVSFGDNIEIVQGLTEDNGYYIDFKFISAGDNEIKVAYNKVLSGCGNEINKSIKCYVYSEFDVITRAKYSAFYIDRVNGVYNVYLEGSAVYPEYLRFYFLLGDVFVTEDITMTAKYNGLDYEIDDFYFNPDEAGEYYFQVKYKDKIVDEFIIVVE